MKKLTAVLLWLVAISINAEPSSTVAYLMNEPVTLFDKGLGELSERVNESLRLEEFPELIQNLNAWAGYDWGKNRITIKGTAYQKAATLQVTAPAQLCEKIIDRIKFNLGYSGVTESLREMGLAGISSMFKHRGFSSTKEPDTLEKDLADIVQVEISLLSSENDDIPYSNLLTCVSNLTEPEVFTSIKQP